MTIVLIFAGFGIMIIGVFGNPSDQNEPPNTATLVFLTGIIILGLGLLKIN